MDFPKDLYSVNAYGIVGLRKLSMLSKHLKIKWFIRYVRNLCWDHSKSNTHMHM